MSAQARILVIDDEAPIRRFLRVALEAEGYGVIEAGTAREGLAMSAREAPTLVVLDLGLPDADGLSVLRDLRGWSQVPVLILSVRADEGDKVEALDAGAQDYVVKPFGVKEFLARVRGLLRDRSTEAVPSVLTVGPLTIDAVDHSATMDGIPLHLTRREFDLLWMLAGHRGRLVTQEMILRAIWGPPMQRTASICGSTSASCGRSWAMTPRTLGSFSPNPVWGIVWPRAEHRQKGMGREVRDDPLRQPQGVARGHFGRAGHRRDDQDAFRQDRRGGLQL